MSSINTYNQRQITSGLIYYLAFLKKVHEKYVFVQ